MQLKKKLISDYASAQARSLLDQRYHKPIILKPFVCPIFVRTQFKIRHVGSSVLLRCNERKFLITAAHVAEEVGKNMMLPGPITLLEYECNFRRTGRSDANEDQVDLAYTELKQFSLSPDYSFWSIAQCEIDLAPKLMRDYIFVGFPSSRNKPNMSMKSLNPIQQIYASLDASKTIYSRLRVDPRSHILTRFSKDDLVDPNSLTKTRAFPNPIGMSGGGVWCWEVSAGTGVIETATLVPKLASIIIDRKMNKKYWVASRITFILESLRLFAPELSSAIPISTTMRPSIKII